MNSDQRCVVTLLHVRQAFRFPEMSLCNFYWIRIGVKNVDLWRYTGKITCGRWLRTFVSKMFNVHCKRLARVRHILAVESVFEDAESTCRVMYCLEISVLKGKVHPRTGHEGPEGEYMFSSTLSLTSVLDWGGWSTPRLGRFTTGKNPVPIV
jgi:hypothetical protein